jgi:hypothetical protein
MRPLQCRHDPHLRLQSRPQIPLYYTCSNHIRCKSRTSAFKTIPAEDVEEKVIEEIVRTIRSPEILTNINRLAESEIRSSENSAGNGNLTENSNYEKSENLQTKLYPGFKESY